VITGSAGSDRHLISLQSVIGAVLFLMALCIQEAQANNGNDIASRALSVSELRTQAIAPRIFTVAAYVIQKYDECPPCPPNAVCETCVVGIYVADDKRPRKPGVAMNDGLYLRTNKAGGFQLGIKYLFRIRYRMEQNAAGAWLQTGPELVDFAHMGRDLQRPGPEE